MWEKSCFSAASCLSVFRFKLPQQKRVCEVVWLCDGPPFTLKSHYVIYLDSWREQCSRAPGPQDPLKGLYIAATIDRRFYRMLYKYVNRCYLIGFCGYTSVPQRKQGCENYQENSSLHSKRVWEIEMSPTLTAGQGGGILHTFQGKLSALEGILSSPGKETSPLTEPPWHGSRLRPGGCRPLDSPCSFFKLCAQYSASGREWLSRFLCILKYVLAVTQGKENKVFGTLIPWLVIS